MSVRIELLAGAATFLTMAYIIFVQSAVLSADQFGMEFRVGARQGEHVHANWLAANKGQQADLVGDGFEDFVALAEVVLAGFVNVAHRGGG